VPGWSRKESAISAGRTVLPAIRAQLLSMDRSESPVSTGANHSPRHSVWQPLRANRSPGQVAAQAQSGASWLARSPVLGSSGVENEIRPGFPRFPAGSPPPKNSREVTSYLRHMGACLPMRRGLVPVFRSRLHSRNLVDRSQETFAAGPVGNSLQRDVVSCSSDTILVILLDIPKGTRR
jgi:hypothetical protein